MTKENKHLASSANKQAKEKSRKQTSKRKDYGFQRFLQYQAK